MTSQHGTDSFFDSDGDREDLGIALKGEYNRGSTPSSDLASSPDPAPTHPDPGPAKKLEPASAAYSRSSTSGNFTAESDTMSRKKGYDDYSLSRSRSRSRSPDYSKSRSRSRSPTYSDSFDSEDSRQDSRRASPVRAKKTNRGRTTGANNRFNSGSSKDSRSSYRSYGSSYHSTKQTKKGPAKKGGRGGMGRSQSVSTLQQQQSPRTTEVSKRMLSAKGHTISRLRSEVDDLRRRYDDAVRENKLMKQLQRRQEAALSKFEDKDEELPQMLRQHAAEVDNLRERLRRTQDREKDKDRRLKSKNEELNRLNDELAKLRRISEDRHLLERDKLQRKVDKLQDGYGEKERRVEDLEKYAENMKKNQRYGGDQWKVREKEYRGRIAFLEDENQTLHLQLKEKEKELDIRNIYSNRPVKPPAKLNSSISPSPRPLAQARATSNEELLKAKPPPRPPLKRSSSAEEKRKPDPAPQEPKPAEEKKEEKRDLSEHEKILMDLDAGFKPHPSPKKKEDDVLKDLDSVIKKRERDEEEQRRVEERKRKEREEQERRNRAKEEEERRRKEVERRRRQEEEEERKRREEEERKPKGRPSFFSDSVNASQNKGSSSAYEPSFLTNTASSSSSTSKPKPKQSTETNSYFKPSFASNTKTVKEESGSYKPSFVTSQKPEDKSTSFGGGYGRSGWQEEKKPSWQRSDGNEEESELAKDFFGERERKQKEEASALVKSSTFIADSDPSIPKTPAFDVDSSEGEDNVPFFGSKPKAFQHPSKPAGNKVAAVNSVRDLHKYSSNVRQSSGSQPHSRGADDEREKRREDEDLASQRKKQKEEAERMAEERRRKDLLLSKMREIDQKPDSRGSKKEYKFTQPVENLHHGKPSHPDLLGSPTASRKKPDDDGGGYAPSFGRRAAAGDKPAAKKGGFFDDDDDDSGDMFSPSKPKQGENKLMSNLFGDTKTDSSNKNRSSFEGTVFSNATKARPVADGNVLPWEKKAATGNASTGGLFSQPNKPNGLTVNVPKSSFDDFEDDIEEVIL